MTPNIILQKLFQELIQNAEDAKAKKVVFMLDHTSYPNRPEKLHDPGLADYQVGYLGIMCIYQKSYRYRYSEHFI